MATNMRSHPETREGEIWLGNVSCEEIESDPNFQNELNRYRGLKTVRFGSQAYDIYGKPISCHRPCFIGVSEHPELNRRGEMIFKTIGTKKPTPRF